MKNLFEITASSRKSLGSSECRRLRATGMVPAIVYGAAKESEKIAVKQNELLKYLEHEAFYSHILSLKIDGREENVVLRDLQRHPSKQTVLHMDMLRVAEDRKLVMNVPLHFKGEDICVGVKQDGGVVAHLLTEIEISCLPKNLPEYLEIDIGDLKMNESLHLSDIALPDGVTVPILERGEENQDSAIVSVFKPKVVEDEVISKAGEGEVEGEDEAATDGDEETQSEGDSTKGSAKGKD